MKVPYSVTHHMMLQQQHNTKGDILPYTFLRNLTDEIDDD